MAKKGAVVSKWVPKLKEIVHRPPPPLWGGATSSFTYIHVHACTYVLVRAHTHMPVHARACVLGEPPNSIHKEEEKHSTCRLYNMNVDLLIDYLSIVRDVLGEPPNSIHKEEEKHSTCRLYNMNVDLLIDYLSIVRDNLTLSNIISY